jgi:hypothetical protein
MTGALATILLFPLVGLALSRLTGRMQPFAAGCGVVGLTLHLSGLLGAPLLPVVSALVIGSLLVLAVKRRIPRRDRVRYPWLPTLLAILPAMWLLAVTEIVPLRDFDGRAFWLLKAKAITEEGSISGPFFEGATTSPRNAYPLLMPLNASAIMTLAGEQDDRQVRWIYALMIIAFALELRYRLARLVSPAAGAWAAAILLWLPQILVEIEGGATSAYNDIAIGAFLAGAFFELVERGSSLRFGFWIAFVALTKSEGFPLAILLLMVGVVVFRSRIVPAFAPLALALITLFTWRAGISRSDELDFASLVFTLPGNIVRFAESLWAVGGQIFAVHDWGLFLLAVVVAAGVLAKRKEWPSLLLVASIVLPMLSLYAAVFAVSDWHMDVMRDNLAPRVITHLLAPLMFLAATAAWRGAGGQAAAEDGPSIRPTGDGTAD